jgi:hypothetical protein
MRFPIFIFEESLMDIPLKDGNFTWSNNRDSPSWSRIDMFLISPKWEDNFLNVIQSKLPRVLSYHFPILLDCGDFQRGVSYFKFEDMWLKSYRFVEKAMH